MNTRNIEIKVRLSRKEADSLNKRVRKSRLSREAYLRHIINGSIPRDAPPPDYFSMMRELYRVGKQRLTAMLKSGKELKVFTISESHLKQFSVEAKRYGVVYCALRGKQPSADGLVDMMVRAEDASKINRIVERFKLATVDTASIKHEIEKSKAEKESAPPPPEQSMSEADRLLEELFGGPAKKEENASPNPFAAGTKKSPPSAPTSKKPDRAAEGTSKGMERKPSVREELREIRQQHQQKAAPPRAKPIQHKPPMGKKKKTKVR